MAEKSKKWNAAVLSTGFLVYMGFNLFLLIRHASYRDEANVWLMAKYLTPFSLLKEIHYQGHPCLWYLLVMPFAKMGLPYKTIEVLSFLVMMAATVIFLWQAKMHTITKLFLLASPFFTYFYPVIARNYCLIALLMMIAAWLYPKRNEKPYGYGLVLGLLVQADTIAVAIAGSLSLAWLFETMLESLQQKKRTSVFNAAKGLWIPLASFIFWIWQMMGVSDCQAYEIKWQGWGGLYRSLQYYMPRIIARLTGWNTLVVIIFAALFLCVCIRISWAAKTATPLFVLFFSYVFQAVFSAVIYELHIWHFLSLGFVMVWTIWVLREKADCAENCSGSARAVVWVLDLLMIMLACCMIGHWNSDEEASSLDRALHTPYSDAGQTAQFIRDTISEDALIITTDVALGSSVRAYLDEYQFYYAGSGIPVTYATWSEEQLRTISVEELDQWVRETFTDIREYYILQTENSCLEDSDSLEQFEQIYRTPQKTTKDEEYVIYHIIL